MRIFTRRDMSGQYQKMRQLVVLIVSQYYPTVTYKEPDYSLKSLSFK